MGGDGRGDEHPALLAFLHIQVPGASVDLQLRFRLRLKQSDVQRVAGAVEDIVDAFAAELGGEADEQDKQSSEQKVACLKQQALQAVEDWNAKLKMVETWKSKADRTTSDLAKMREAYLKEVTVLKEQLHQRARAEKASTDIVPQVQFIPRGFTLEDKGCGKHGGLCQELDAELQAEKDKLRARVASLNEQLGTVRMTLHRKDRLLTKVLQGQATDDPSREAGLDEAPSSGGPAGGTKPRGDREHFCQHLERKFGSLERAARRLRAGYGRAEGLDFDAFAQLLAGVGYKGDADCLFAALSQPGRVALRDLLGEGLGHEAPSVEASATQPPETTHPSPGTVPGEERAAKADHRSAEVQTMIDGSVLDKAMEYYDKLAEAEWKKLLRKEASGKGGKGDHVSEAGSEGASSFSASTASGDDVVVRHPYASESSVNSSATCGFRRCISAPASTCDTGDEHADAASSAVGSPTKSQQVRLPKLPKPTGTRPQPNMGPRRHSAPNLDVQEAAAPVEAKSTAPAAPATSGARAAKATSEKGIQCALTLEIVPPPMDDDRPRVAVPPRTPKEFAGVRDILSRHGVKNLDSLDDVVRAPSIKSTTSRPRTTVRPLLRASCPAVRLESTAAEDDELLLGSFQGERAKTIAPPRALDKMQLLALTPRRPDLRRGGTGPLPLGGERFTHEAAAAGAGPGMGAPRTSVKAGTAGQLSSVG